jgi:predicted phage terminase large subunit-like protein
LQKKNQLLSILEDSKTQTEKTKAEESLFYFAKYILGFEDFEYEVHGEWDLFLAGDKQYKLVLIPRDHFKSSYFTIAYPLQELCKDHKERILITNATFDNAKTFLSSIKHQIERNEKLKWWDIEQGEPWSTEEIAVRCETIHKEPSISIAGVGSQIPGLHYNIIIWDDLVNDKTITSKDQLDKTIDWWKYSLSVLEPGGLGIVVGNRWHFGDLYGYILDNLASKFDVIKRKAIKEDGTAYFPQRYSLEKLQDKKESQGSWIFSTQYMNEPISPEDAVFRKEWIKYYDKLPAIVRKFMTIEPAISPDSGANFSVIMTCAVDEGNNLYVVDYVREHLLPKELIDWIFRKFVEHRHVKLGIETVAFQKVLKFWLIDQMRERSIFLPIEELKTETSKEIRIMGLQPRFETGAIYIRKNMLDLEDELLRFPKGQTDDLIDALAHQLQIIHKPQVSKKEDVPYMSLEWFEKHYGDRQPKGRSLSNPYLYRGK